MTWGIVNKIHGLGGLSGATPAGCFCSSGGLRLNGFKALTLPKNRRSPRGSCDGSADRDGDAAGGAGATVADAGGEAAPRSTVAGSRGGGSEITVAGAGDLAAPGEAGPGGGAPAGSAL